MKKRDDEKKGFSLLELLAVIFIISLILGVTGYFIMKTMNTSEDKTNVLAINSIKESANIYVKEYQNQLSWQDEINENNQYTGNLYTCVSIKELINKGYLKNEELKNKEQDFEYIIVTKDENNVIIKEEIDLEQNICGNDIKKKVTIPTAKEYCINPTYNPTASLTNPQDLTSITETEEFKFKNNTGIDVSNYEVKVSLNGGYIWEDGSEEDKTIICSIKKKEPTLSFKTIDGEEYSNGEIGTELGEKELTLITDTPGTLSIKTSDKNTVTASIDTPDIINEKIITINKLATRNALTYITITLEPKDKKNYKSTSIVYTIGDINWKHIQKPTTSVSCNTPLYYNKNSQTLAQTNEGFELTNNTATNIGTYTVTAKLNYGYKWNDDTTTPVEFTCTILPPTMEVFYDEQGGTECNPPSKNVTYETKYGPLCNNTTNPGYQFTGWYKEQNKITSEITVTDINNHTLYANWTPNTYTINYDCNGGTGSITSSSHTYGVAKKINANTCEKKGHTFGGWTDGVNTYTNQQTVKNLTTVNNGIINLKAIWNVNSYKVTLTKGSGISSVTGGGTYKYGDTVTIKATASTGYHFKDWTGTKTATTATYTFTMPDSNVTNTANAELNQHTVTLTKGSGISSVTGGGTYKYGDTVTINAIASTGYHFSSWTGTKTSTTASYTFTMPDSNVTNTANATANTYTIEYSCNGGGGSTASSSHTYGVAKNLTANGCTMPGHSFAGWTYGTNTYSDQQSVKDLTSIDGGTVQLTAKWTRTDNTNPTCGAVQIYQDNTWKGNYSWSNKNNVSWTNKNRTIRVACSDTGGSGCSNDYFEATFTANAESGTIQISDKSGLKTDCSVTVKIDKTPPTLSYTTKANRKTTITYDGVGNVYFTYSDTGGSGLYTDSSNNVRFQAKAYVTAQNKTTVHCNSANWYYGSACVASDPGTDEVRNNSKHFWRAYRISDNAGNFSNIVCTYEKGKTPISKVNGTADSCTVEGHTFNK